MSDLPHHGGDLTYATRRYGMPAGGWLDLSTGINPFPYPAPAIPPETLARLPDREALVRLIETARAVYRVPAGVDLIAVPGTEIAIRLLPFLAPSGKVAIVGPTYNSHLEAWRGDQTIVVNSVEAIPGDAAVAVVANPNNPDGRLTPPAVLPALARRLSLVVIDEAFADVAPDYSVIPEMRGTNAIVLRSFGKFFGLAGLRLGFVAAAPVITGRISQHLGDWPVSGPALAIGQAALADVSWQGGTRARLKMAGAALRDVLTGHGLTIAGHTDLFVLVETANARALYDGLLRHGILTRAFADNPRWLRFGLPAEARMKQLAAALSAIG